MNYAAIGIVVTLLLAWSGLLIGIIKWLLSRNQAHIDKSFTSMEARFITLSETNGKEREKERDELQRVERELLDLKAELPVLYVRREDSIRQEVVINSKLDALAAKLDDFRDRRGNE